MVRVVYSRWGTIANKKNLGLGVHGAQISIITIYKNILTLIYYCNSMVPPCPLITVYDKKHRVSGGDKHGGSRLLYCQRRGFLSFASTSHFCNIIIRQDCRQTFLLGLNIGE